MEVKFSNNISLKAHIRFASQNSRIFLGKVSANAVKRIVTFIFFYYYFLLQFLRFII